MYLKSVTKERELGKSLRDEISDNLRTSGLYRPLPNWWYQDEFNKICKAHPEI